MRRMHVGPPRQVLRNSEMTTVDVQLNIPILAYSAMKTPSVCGMLADQGSHPAGLIKAPR
jgi:hypothetical protein